MWVFTVASEMYSAAAISLLLLPPTISCSTSVSRAGQRGRAHALRQPLGDRGRDARFAGVHGADGIHQFVARHAFQQIAAGARLQGAVNILIPIEGGEHDDARLGKIHPDAGRSLPPHSSAAGAGPST